MIVLVHPCRAGAIDRRADRAGEAGAGQAQLRLGRQRQRRASRRRAVCRHGRHQAHPHPLQGLGAGAERPGRRSRQDRSSASHAAGAGRREGRQQGARARGHRAQALAAVPDVPTVAEARCPDSRRCCTTASWRRPARRGRSSTSSMRRCATAVATDDIKRRLAADGAEPLPSDARGICRRYRPRRDQVVGDRQEVRGMKVE